jgi:hypothetical protein
VLLGEPERGLKVNTNLKPQTPNSILYRHSGMFLAGIHSYYSFWIPACAGMTSAFFAECFYFNIRCNRPGFDCSPFCVVEHWKHRTDKREDCLSDSEFRSARSRLKRTEQPKANTVGWSFFWTLFFDHSKKRVSPIKGEKHGNALAQNQKRNSLLQAIKKTSAIYYHYL